MSTVAFKWPVGPKSSLKIYEEDHPQRKPTEEYFADSVRQDITDVRTAKGTGYINLWLLIDSLKNLEDESVDAGFHTWLWAIEAVLGADSCKAIGKRVCEEEGFTIEEGESIMNGAYRQEEAKKYNLPDTATWDEVHSARDMAYRAEMTADDSE